MIGMVETGEVDRMGLAAGMGIGGMGRVVRVKAVLEGRVLEARALELLLLQVDRVLVVRARKSKPLLKTGLSFNERNGLLTVWCVG
jgi:hypothetical protein